MQCLLIGNFGVGNVGDEALREYFHRAFPMVEWQVLSAHPGPGELDRLPLGFRSLFRLDWIKTLAAYTKTEAVVFGGGSLLTDTESAMACILWWLHTVPARLLGKDIHFAFQGVGPFKTSFGRWFARSALRSATSISVRDRQSFLRAKKLVKNTKIVQYCDPVIWLIEKEKVDISTKNVLILIPRKNSSDKFTAAAQKALRSSSWEQVNILSMEPDHSGEQQNIEKLRSGIGESTVVQVRSLRELLEHVAQSAHIVSERYHGALPALMYGKSVDIVSQAEGDKLSTLRDGLPDSSLVEDAAQNLRTALSIE